MFRISLLCLTITILLGCGHMAGKPNGPIYRLHDFPLGHDLNPIETAHDHHS